MVGSSGSQKETVLTCWVDIDFHCRELNDFAHANDPDGTDGNVACFENLNEAGAGNFVLSPAYASMASIRGLIVVPGKRKGIWLNCVEANKFDFEMPFKEI